jgi:hypothetical protein
MLIRFTRLTNERHRFEIVRDDGSREAHELETRSTLAHDLAHYAVEAEAGLTESFYGRLAAGVGYGQLTTAPVNGPQAMQTERVVVMLQSAFKTAAEPDPRQLFARISAAFTAGAEQQPAWLTPQGLQRMLGRLRHVQGQWRATPFHHTLELKFP